MSWLHTLMPEMAMDPKRKVVMPPMTHVGVLAKKAPICKPNSILSLQSLLNDFTSECTRQCETACHMHVAGNM